jgi:hypothetical protein
MGRQQCEGIQLDCQFRKSVDSLMLFFQAAAVTSAYFRDTGRLRKRLLVTSRMGLCLQLLEPVVYDR